MYLRGRQASLLKTVCTLVLSSMCESKNWLYLKGIFLLNQNKLDSDPIEWKGRCGLSHHLGFIPLEQKHFRMVLSVLGSWFLNPFFLKFGLLESAVRRIKDQMFRSLKFCLLRLIHNHPLSEHCCYFRHRPWGSWENCILCHSPPCPPKATRSQLHVCHPEISNYFPMT